VNVVEGGSDDRDSEEQDRDVEELARALAERIRAMPNRHEMTDYAVSLLKESSEDTDQAELARDTKEMVRRSDPFNPIAFGIPLFVIGAVLAMTGLLTGIGMLVIAIAIVMVLYGLVVSLLFRRRDDGSA
jgi:hypothetical protein